MTANPQLFLEGTVRHLDVEAVVGGQHGPPNVW